MDAQPAGIRSLREHPDHHAEGEPGACGEKLVTALLGLDEWTMVAGTTTF
jgi:hypothetical protein